MAAALDDAGISAEQVDGTAISATDRSFVSGAEAVLGPTPRGYNCRCGLGPVALDSAWKAVSSGVSEVVVCLGFDRGGPGLPLAEDRPWLEAQAAAARELLQHSGAEERHLAQVAAKNLRHGSEAPGATVGAVGVDEVLASEMLLWPLRRLMVAPPAYSAAALVLAARPAATAARRRRWCGPR